MKNSIRQFLEENDFVDIIEKYDAVCDLADIVFDVMGISEKEQDKPYKE